MSIFECISEPLISRNDGLKLKGVFVNRRFRTIEVASNFRKEKGEDKI